LNVRKLLKKAWRTYAHYELVLFFLVVILIIGDYQIIQQLPEFVLNSVITTVLLVYVTVEGILVGLTSQIKLKFLKDCVMTVGIAALLYAVYLFMIVTYQTLQLHYTSTNVATAQFNYASVLFLFFIELFAIGALLPPAEKILNPLDTDP